MIPLLWPNAFTHPSSPFPSREVCNPNQAICQTKWSWFSCIHAWHSEPQLKPWLFSESCVVLDFLSYSHDILRHQTPFLVSCLLLSWHSVLYVHHLQNNEIFKTLKTMVMKYIIQWFLMVSYINENVSV